MIIAEHLKKGVVYKLRKNKKYLLFYLFMDYIVLNLLKELYMVKSFSCGRNEKRMLEELKEIYGNNLSKIINLLIRQRWNDLKND